ncbi:SGNH/GDSL hydrolase family protein [Streptomyces sp. NA04227]|uniref:SGNH/GDSL hydrolase family protein n=1 Tax=Streptomyces sp. NA04227 TaxID=2742136 RepID=UPI00158FAFFF|nr:SGNH/GDSL hydrolase family protein [Streptomyces sp. NA04227]
MSSRARVARRIAAGAAYGSGGIGLLGVAAVGVVLTEVELAKRQVGNSVAGGGDPPPTADGLYGNGIAAHHAPHEVLRLAMLGDSTAAGQGVRLARETPGALLASGLAAVAERPVHLRNVAQPGACSDDLRRQLKVLLDDPGPVPDVCVVMIGANDVTRRMPFTESVRALSETVRGLCEAGCEVVVGTCPDLGTVQPVYQPLSWLARRASRQLAAAQTIGTVEQGGRTVSLGDLLGPEFAANRDLFGPDRYHPSAQGYATAAMAMLPTVCAVLGLWPEGERPDTSRREGFLPVARAAAEAAAESGTEVAAVTTTGPRGPWALLKRRRRRRIHSPGPEPERDAGAGDEQDAHETGDGNDGSGGSGSGSGGSNANGRNGGKGEDARPDRRATVTEESGPGGG